MVALTKRDGERYANVIERVTDHALARAVKLADIADNLDPGRLGKLPLAVQEKFRGKYRPAQDPRYPTFPSNDVFSKKTRQTAVSVIENCQRRLKGYDRIR